MAVGSKELRRGIALGVYPDEERAARENRRLQLAEEREARTAGNEEIRTKLELLRFENEQIKKQAAEAAEARVLTDSIEATKKLAAIPASSADFELQLKKITSEHPRAMADKAFHDQVSWNQDIHKAWREEKSAYDKLAEQRRYEEQQKAAERQLAADARKQAIAELGKLPGAKLKSASVTEKGEPAPVFGFGEDNKPSSKDFGTETVKIDDKTTIRRPLPAPGTPEARAALEAQHAKLEADMVKSGNLFTGKPKADKIGALNAVKAQLGYDQLDPSTGQVRPKPAAAPAVTVGEPTTIVVPASAAPSATPTPAAAKPAASSVDIHEQARAAIAAGAPRDAVLERLKQKGGDPSKL